VSDAHTGCTGARVRRLSSVLGVTHPQRQLLPGGGLYLAAQPIRAGMCPLSMPAVRDMPRLSSTSITHPSVHPFIEPFILSCVYYTVPLKSCDSKHHYMRNFFEIRLQYYLSHVINASVRRSPCGNDKDTDCAQEPQLLLS
jgi:hypothetical protein